MKANVFWIVTVEIDERFGLSLTALIMETINISETLVNFYQITQSNNLLVKTVIFNWETINNGIKLTL